MSCFLERARLSSPAEAVISNSSSMGFCFNSDRFIRWFYIAIGLKGFELFELVKFDWVFLKPRMAQKKVIGRQNRQKEKVLSEV